MISVGGELAAAHSGSSLPQPPPSSPPSAQASKHLQQGMQHSAQAGGKSPASSGALESPCSRLIFQGGCTSPPLLASREHQAPPFTRDLYTVTPGNTCRMPGHARACALLHCTAVDRAARGRAPEQREAPSGACHPIAHSPSPRELSELDSEPAELPPGTNSQQQAACWAGPGVPGQSTRSGLCNTLFPARVHPQWQLVQISQLQGAPALQLRPSNAQFSPMFFGAKVCGALGDPRPAPLHWDLGRATASSG